MKYRIAAGMLAASLLLFTGCDWSRGAPNVRGPAGETCQGIMAAIAADDRDSLLDLFAPSALAKAEDTDAGVEYIFSVISGEGEVIDTGGMGGSTEYNQGETVESITAVFDVENEDGVFIIRFEQCTKHVGDDDAVGITKLMVVPQGEDENEQVSRFFFDARIKSCIYVPGEA